MLDRKLFDESISWLASYYNYNLSGERREHYWNDFKNEDDTIFSDVLAKLIPERLKSFPSPQELREQLAVGREKAHDKTKAEEMRERAPLANFVPKSELGEDWLRLTLGLFAKSPTPANRRAYLAEMKALHEKYPTAGWLARANELRQLWITDGKSLDDEPVEPVPEIEHKPEPVQEAELELELIAPEPKND